MATAPKIDEVSTVTSIADDKKLVLPDIKEVQKVSGWMTPDGVFHISSETAKETVTNIALKDFAAINNIKDMGELAKALAPNLPTIVKRIDAAFQNIGANPR